MRTVFCVQLLKKSITNFFLKQYWCLEREQVYGGRATMSILEMDIFLYDVRVTHHKLSLFYLFIVLTKPISKQKKIIASNLKFHSTNIFHVISK